MPLGARQTIWGRTIAVTLAGSAYTGTLNSGDNTYTDGTHYRIKPGSNSVGSDTLNFNGIGAKNIIKYGNLLINANDLVANRWYDVVYNSTLDAFEVRTPYFIVKNTIYVAPNGNDTTGVVERFDAPFLTIGAAISASSSGYTIIVMPGTYTITVDLNPKNGTNIYFTNGAIVNCTTFDTFGDAGAATYSITGDGEFTTTTGTILHLTGAGTVTFEAKKISCSGSGNIFEIFGSTAYINVKGTITGSTGYCFWVNSTGKCYASAKLITSTYTIALVNTATDICVITADSITSSYSVNMFSIVGTVTIKAPLTYTGTGIVISYLDSSNCTHKFYGDIVHSSSAKAINNVSTGGTGTVDFYGTISGTGYINLDNTLTYTFYNDITTNVSTTPSIVMGTSAGIVKIKAKVTNLNANAASYGITKAGGTLILDRATIVTSGGTESVHSGAAQNIKVYGALVQNVALSGNITDIAGGSVQTDTDVS